MSRAGAIRRIEAYFDDGGFFADLARRVAIHSESQEPARRRHLDAAGFAMVRIAPRADAMAATRLDPGHPWARWAAASIDATTGAPTAVLPNLGGSLPNEVFSEVLGLPTIWAPHSYLSCSQHAPNEHILETTSREALRIMTGLFWDLGDPNGGRPG